MLVSHEAHEMTTIVVIDKSCWWEYVANTMASVPFKVAFNGVVDNCGRRADGAWLSQFDRLELQVWIFFDQIGRIKLH